MICLLSLVKIRETLFLLLGLVFGVAAFPALSATYTAYPGSRINIQSINQPFSGGGSGSITVGSRDSWSRPLLGAVIVANAGIGYSCSLASSFATVDGLRGAKLNSNNIIAGFTGSITNGIGHYKPADTQNWIQLAGGLSFSQSGEPSGIGSTSSNYVSVFCGASNEIRGGDSVSSPGMSGLGNQYADVNLSVWIYVPKTTAPGSYPLTSVSLVQGPGSFAINNQAIIPLIYEGDTIDVLPPPCTIATETNIVFDTTREEGMKVSAPVTFTCETINQPTEAQAYLQVTPVGSTQSDTELNMMIDGEAAGGVVRGYAGQNINANCTNTAQSLSFSIPFATPLGNVTTGNQQQLPLIWQLCRTGNEKAGKATGSALLNIIYK